MRIRNAYLWGMKQRKNLTLEPETVAYLSMQGTSISEAIGQLVKNDQQRRKSVPDDEPLFLKWKGKLGNWLTDEDFEEDDRAGHELRETRMYELRKGNK